MSASKTIKINPELFKVSGRKSRKNNYNGATAQKPTISAEQLKSKLQSRVKEHKKEETATVSAPKSKRSAAHKSKTVEEGNDEFSNSLNFFSELSQRKKTQERISTPLNKTIKKPILTNYATTPMHKPVTAPLSDPIVDLSFPQDLYPVTPKLVANHTASYPSGSSLKLNYTVDNLIPGCLKNGLKPTYRSLKRNPAPTRNNSLTFSIPGQPQPPIAPPQAPINVREEKLNQLKQKQQQQQQQQVPIQQQQQLPIQQQQQLPIQQQLQQQESQINQLPDILPDLVKEEIVFKDVFSQANAPRVEPKKNDIHELLVDTAISQHVDETPENVGDDVLNILYPIKHKKKIKRTTKRTYTVGRNRNTNGPIGVLIKDAGTRKKIMSAHKELKNTQINDLKKYLREHNLIKAGSSAPNDVLRKTYECAMMSGEIMNTNEETLLHNFINESNTSS
jgi:hypothetical protein